MEKIFIVCLAFVVFSTGCAHGNWIKQDYSEKQFYEDSLACEKEANSMVAGAWVWIIPYAGIWWGITNTARKHRYYSRCLEHKGYTYQMQKPIEEEKLSK